MKIFKVFYKYKDFELSASQNEFLTEEAAELFKKRYQATHKDDILFIKKVDSWYFTPEHPERQPEPNTEKDGRHATGYEVLINGDWIDEYES